MGRFVGSSTAGADTAEEQAGTRLEEIRSSLVADKVAVVLQELEDPATGSAYMYSTSGAHSRENKGLILTDKFFVSDALISGINLPLLSPPWLG